MKNLIFLLIATVTLFSSCNSNVEKTELYIQNFFDSNAQFACSDSVSGNVKMKFLYNQLNMEIMSFEFAIPDSIKFSDFHNSSLSQLKKSHS